MNNSTKNNASGQGRSPTTRPLACSLPSSPNEYLFGSPPDLHGSPDFYAPGSFSDRSSTYPQSPSACSLGTLGSGYVSFPDVDQSSQYGSAPTATPTFNSPLTFSEPASWDEPTAWDTDKRTGSFNSDTSNSSSSSGMSNLSQRSNPIPIPRSSSWDHHLNMRSTSASSEDRFNYLEHFTPPLQEAPDEGIFDLDIDEGIFHLEL